MLCYFLRRTMGGDGSNIRLIYIEDEQPLVFPQIAKNEAAPCANVPHFPLPPTECVTHQCCFRQNRFANNLCNVKNRAIVAMCNIVFVLASNRINRKLIPFYLPFTYLLPTFQYIMSQKCRKFLHSTTVAAMYLMVIF